MKIKKFGPPFEGPIYATILSVTFSFGLDAQMFKAVCMLFR